MKLLFRSVGVVSTTVLTAYFLAGGGHVSELRVWKTWAGMGINSREVPLALPLVQNRL